jgi:hypothetical protein
MKRSLLPTLLVIALFLAACSPAAPTAVPAPAQPTASTAEPVVASTDLARSDAQGAVTVSVTPINLSDPTDKLEFNVSLETHSVDLSMDLATLATLTTDTGLAVQATTWDAPRGGHHVQGKLIFPATQDGKSILEGTTKLTLTITNVDAPSRIFEWQLQ